MDTQEELEYAIALAEYEHSLRIAENQDKKEDQIRSMAWWALFGMIFYPILLLATTIVAVYVDIGDAATIIGQIAPSYFVANAGLLAAFFGANAYQNKNLGRPGVGGGTTVNVRPPRQPRNRINTPEVDER